MIIFPPTSLLSRGSRQISKFKIRSQFSVVKFIPSRTMASSMHHPVAHISCRHWSFPSVNRRREYREYQHQSRWWRLTRRATEDSGWQYFGCKYPFLFYFALNFYLRFNQLFAGRPSLKKLQLWDDDAVFEDPLTKAVGRKQFEPQWYGLAAAFSEIERLHHEVVSAGNPISMDLRTRYVVKGISKEQTVNSKVNISYDKATGKITKVEDKWDGKLPDSSFTNVSIAQLLSPWWYLHYAESWGWRLWSFTWDTWWWQVCSAACRNRDTDATIKVKGVADFQTSWQAMRKLNAVTVPKLVGVPKNDEEDAAKGHQWGLKAGCSKHVFILAR